MKMELETLVASLALMGTIAPVKQLLNYHAQLELGDLSTLLEVLLNAILAQLDLIAKLMAELLILIAKNGDFVILDLQLKESALVDTTAITIHFISLHVQEVTIVQRPHFYQNLLLSVANLGITALQDHHLQFHVPGAPFT